MTLRPLPRLPSPKSRSISSPRHDSRSPSRSRSRSVHLQQARYLHFQDPRFTAKFMAKYLNSRPAFNDVSYDFATQSEITIHGNMPASASTCVCTG